MLSLGRAVVSVPCYPRLALAGARQYRLSGRSGLTVLARSTAKLDASVAQTYKYNNNVSQHRTASSGRRCWAQSWVRRIVDTAVATCFGAAICLMASQPTFAKVEAIPSTPVAADVSPTFALPGMEKIQPPPGVDVPDPAAAQALLDSDLTPEERATVAIFERNTPSVVNIANLAAYSRNYSSSETNAPCSPYSMDVTMIPQGTGSGFVWDNKGHVVTNYHVVKGSSALKVTLYDSTSCTAKIVGSDENKDIAVLKLDVSESQAAKMRKVELGRSTGLFVGQRVYAIGNPFGLDHTLTSGLVSGLQREIQANAYGPKIKGVIQTDAAINPGNSGGVLLNSSGKLIGVNSAILDPSQRGSFSGVGFAIPVDMVKGLVDQILTYGQVIRPVLGITMGPPALISRLNIDGVLVYSAPRGGPAGDAGVQGCQRSQFGDLVVGDIIIGLNDTKVRNYADLFEALDQYKPGDKVNLEVFRTTSRKQVSIPITLGTRSTEVQDG